MPDKTNTDFVSESFLASATIVMPAISTQAILSAAPATASGQFVDPSLFIVRVVNVNADRMNASALMGNAIGFVQVTIPADVFVATATFNSPGVVISIPGGPMTAHAFMRDDAVYLNDWNILVLTQTYKQMADAISGVGTWMIGDVK
jgi:hypothetical protein